MNGAPARLTAKLLSSKRRPIAGSSSSRMMLRRASRTTLLSLRRRNFLVESRSDLTIRVDDLTRKDIYIPEKYRIYFDAVTPSSAVGIDHVSGISSRDCCCLSFGSSYPCGIQQMASHLTESILRKKSRFSGYVHLCHIIRKKVRLFAPHIKRSKVLGPVSQER